MVNKSGNRDVLSLTEASPVALSLIYVLDECENMSQCKVNSNMSTINSV